jgi:hypothetical protein
MKKTHLLVLGVLTTSLLAMSEDNGEKPEPPKPTSHSVRHIEGWTVRVDDRLLAAPHEELGKRALRLLESKFMDIEGAVVEDRLEKLKAVTIVLDLSHGKLRAMQYHPSAGWLKKNGYSTGLAKCVHIPRAEGFVSPQLNTKQPWVVLHELAHAYHDQVLGFEDSEIKAAWQRFVDSGRYESVLHISGRMSKHYAMTDQKEFFAEMSESFFGMNDFFPFNRAELQCEEPPLYELLCKIWGRVPPT